MGADRTSDIISGSRKGKRGVFSVFSFAAFFTKADTPERSGHEHSEAKRLFFSVFGAGCPDGLRSDRDGAVLRDRQGCMRQNREGLGSHGR